jgi:methyl-accepting chemotaxis protein
MKLQALLALAVCALAIAPAPAQAATDAQIAQWAKAAAQECGAALEKAIDSHALKEADVFDRLYVPIPNTDPPKFHTRYDAYTDQAILPIEEKYLAKDPHIAFVVLVDKNGYLPTHNLKYTKPLTGDRAKDLVGNRTKRLFNDKTGLSAARNKQPVLVQEYKRDSGELMKDCSVPVFVKGKHWGALRFGYKN